MIDRMAVILIGQYRTFAITSRYLFEFFASKAHTVDYYFVTWPTSGGHNTRYYEPLVRINDGDITKFFDQAHLVDYRIVPDIPKKHTYYRMAYLSRIGQKLKKQTEQKEHFVYDQVVETRPDVYLRQPYSGEWELCGPLEYGGHPIEIKNGHAFTDDCYIRSDSATHDIISNRLSEFDNDEINRPRLADSEKYGYDHHTRFAEWLMKNNINRIATKDYAFINVVRNPKLINIDLNQLSADQLNGTSYEYAETNPRPKFISVFHNIHPGEFTATHNIFLEAHGDSILNSVRYSAQQLIGILERNQETYDWVRFVQDTDNDPDQFYEMIEQARKDCVYVFHNSFYCSINLYATLANLPESLEYRDILDIFVNQNIPYQKVIPK